MKPRDSSWRAILRDLRQDEEAPAPPLPARIGKYEILRTLGATRSSTVYLATDPELRRNVAIKVLREDRALPEFVRRFEREGAFTASLRHSGLIAIHEVGRWIEPDRPPLPFIVMDYHGGGTLAGRRLDPRRAAELLAAVAAALGHAHEHGIVHRDLKPENILLDASGAPIVSDFGLARDLDGSTRETQAGTLLGTPRYMAPEQIGGDLKSVDARTDVHALGAILFELLTGRAPFAAEQPSALFHQILTEEPPAPSVLEPGVPAPLNAVTLKALEKDPSRRYATASEFGADLQRFLRDEPVTARPPSAGSRLRRWAARHPSSLAILTGLAASVLLIGVYARWTTPRVPAPVVAPPPAPIPARWRELGGSGSGGGVSNTPTASFDCCVTVDRQDRPVVVWREYAGAGLWLRRWSGTAWEDVGRSTAGGGFGAPRKAENPRLAAGTGPGLFLAWDDDSSGRPQVFLLRWNGASWDSIDGSGGGMGLSRSTVSGRNPSLAVDGKGRAFVAWHDDASGRPQIYLKHSDGGAWAELGGSASGVGVSAAEGYCTWASVAVDSSGNPGLAWLEHGTMGFRVRVRRWTGAAWGPVLDPPDNAVQPIGEWGWSVDRTMVAFDARGNLFVSWNSGPSGHGAIRAVVLENGAWRTLGAATVNETSDAGGVCMTVDGSGRPILAWTDSTAGIANVYVKRWSGTAWEELDGSARGGGLSASVSHYTGGPWVAVTSAGEPVVAWNQHGEAPPGDEILLKIFSSRP